MDKGKVITQIIAARGDYAFIEDLEAVAGFLHFNKKGKLVPCSPPMRLVYTLKDREHRLRFPVLRHRQLPLDLGRRRIARSAGLDPTTGILLIRSASPSRACPIARAGGKPRPRSSASCA